MVLRTAQLGALQAESQRAYAAAMLAHFRRLGMPFLPQSDADALQYLQLKVLEARRFRLLSGKSCERFLYLCLSYPQLNTRQYPPEILDNLSWPDRSEDDKLEVLYHMLTNHSNN